jgi:hypothetical protein
MVENRIISQVNTAVLFAAVRVALRKITQTFNAGSITLSSYLKDLRTGKAQRWTHIPVQDLLVKGS